MGILHIKSWKWGMQKASQQWQVGSCGLEPSGKAMWRWAGRGTRTHLYDSVEFLYLISVIPYSHPVKLGWLSLFCRLGNWGSRSYVSKSWDQEWAEAGWILRCPTQGSSPHHCCFLPGSHHLFFTYLAFSASTWLRILAFRPLSHSDPSRSDSTFIPLSLLVFSCVSWAQGLRLSLSFLPRAPWGG